MPVEKFAEDSGFVTGNSLGAFSLPLTHLTELLNISVDLFMERILKFCITIL